MGEFSIAHWLIVLVILLLFFGPSKLPGLGASLGKAIRGFKAGLNEADPTADNQNQASNRPPEQLEKGSENLHSSTSKVGETEKIKDPHSKG
jgi:TatA/E family protein of Tat protein translocase